jgi:hypothetical protein
MRRVMQQEVERMLRHEVIEPANSPYNANVVLVPKKDGKIRFAISYENLNLNTRRDSFPLVRIQDALDALGGSKYFSSLDVSSAFWAVPLDEES